MEGNYKQKTWTEGKRSQPGDQGMEAGQKERSLQKGQVFEQKWSSGLSFSMWDGDPAQVVGSAAGALTCRATLEVFVKPALMNGCSSVHTYNGVFFSCKEWLTKGNMVSIRCKNLNSVIVCVCFWGRQKRSKGRRGKEITGQQYCMFSPMWNLDLMTYNVCTYVTNNYVGNNEEIQMRWVGGEGTVRDA